MAVRAPRRASLTPPVSFPAKQVANMKSEIETLKERISRDFSALQRKQVQENFVPAIIRQDSFPAKETVENIFYNLPLGDYDTDLDAWIALLDSYELLEDLSKVIQSL